MKNLILAFLFSPIFSFGQYGLRDCHFDLVFGYDYGRYNLQTSITDATSIQSYRIGTNINYPVSDRGFLVTGFRVASKNSTFIRYIGGAPNITVAPTRIRWNSFYGEVPFSFRYMIKNIDWENLIYVEGGMQFNIYIFSFREGLEVTESNEMKNVNRDEGRLDKNG